MTSIHTINFFNEHKYSGQKILESLKIPNSNINYQVSYDLPNNTIYITGDRTDYKITFFKDSYMVLKKFPTYEIVEHRFRDCSIMREEVIYSIGEDTLTFEQINNSSQPDEVYRSIYLHEKGAERNKPSLIKSVAYHPDTNYLESYTSIKKAFATTSKHRFRIGRNNIILCNTDHSLVFYNGRNIVGKTITTCSTDGEEANVVINSPDLYEIMEVSNYCLPSIMIDGSFIDVPNSDDPDNESNELKYRFFLYKTNGSLEIGISFGTINEEPQGYVRSYPTNSKEYINIKDIDTLINKMKEEKFLDFPVDYPIAERIMSELIQLKIDLYKNTLAPEQSIDFFDFNLPSSDDFNHMCFHIYEHLDRYYEEAKKICNVNKSEKKEV